jgi:hypothetical protein
LFIMHVSAALIGKDKAKWTQPNAENESQQSDNDGECYMYVNWEAICSQLCITKVLAALIAERESHTVTAPFSR